MKIIEIEKEKKDFSITERKNKEKTTLRPSTVSTEKNQKNSVFFNAKYLNLVYIRKKMMRFQI